MAPLCDFAMEKPEEAGVCIDQFEFPDIPCAYPVIWIGARKVVGFCQAMGKRLCDALEWEGACAGALKKPDYRFDLAAVRSPDAAIRLMQQTHNQKYRGNKSWCYGDDYRVGICAGSSSKTSRCTGGSWSGCGSNAFPAGFSPQCRSSLTVYDLHGNTAEHMNLPLNENETSYAPSLANRGIL